MRDKEINIGDMVRVRDWDDMEREFGISEIGDIPMRNKHTKFAKHMRYLCGETLTILGRYEGLFGYGYKFAERFANGWFICSDMLESLEDDVCEFTNDDDLKALFY